MVGHPEWTEDREALRSTAAHLAADDRRRGWRSARSPRCSSWRRPSASRTRRSATAPTIPDDRPLPGAGLVRRRTRATASPNPARPTASTRPLRATRAGAAARRARRLRREPRGRRRPRAGRAGDAAVRGAAGARPHRVLGRPAVHARARDARRRGRSTSSRRRGPTAPASLAGVPRSRSPTGGSSPGSSPASTPNKKSVTLDLGDRPGRRAAAPAASRPATSSSRTTRPGCSSSSGLDVDVAPRASGPTSSWCACPASGSTDRGATTPRSPSSSRTPPGSRG